MNDRTDIAEVYDLLYRLGFSATNSAFFQLSYAVYLAALNPHWLLKPSQRLYPEVADQYNTNPLRRKARLCLRLLAQKRRVSAQSYLPPTDDSSDSHTVFADACALYQEKICVAYAVVECAPLSTAFYL